MTINTDPLILPVLQAIINDCESMWEDEKNYWKKFLKAWDPKFVKKLINILLGEKIKLEEVDRQYNLEIAAINKRYQEEWNSIFNKNPDYGKSCRYKSPED